MYSSPTTVSFGEGDKDGDGATDALALPPLCPAKTCGTISL